MRRIAPLLLVCMIGCEKASEKAVETATGTEITKNGKDVTVKTKDGTVEVKAGDKTTEIKGPEGSLKMAEGQVPQGFPLPIYKDASVINGVVHEDADKGKMYQVLLRSPDPVADIAAFYTKAVTDKGLEAKPTQLKNPDMEMTMLQAETDKVQANINITRQTKEDSTAVSLAWHVKK